MPQESERSNIAIEMMKIILPMCHVSKDENKIFIFKVFYDNMIALQQTRIQI